MTRQHAAEYIHNLAAELTKVARSNGLIVVAHCLAMAALEASKGLTRNRSRGGRTGKFGPSQE